MARQTCRGRLVAARPAGYSVVYRLILARLRRLREWGGAQEVMARALAMLGDERRCLRPWLLAETDFGVLVHLAGHCSHYAEHKHRHISHQPRCWQHLILFCSEALPIQLQTVAS